MVCFQREHAGLQYNTGVCPGSCPGGMGEHMNINADLLDELEVTGMLEEALQTYYDCPTCHSQSEHGFL